MNIFYDFNQRVHLKRDTSQYGRIGCGGYGSTYDVETQSQLVFWEHKNADIVSCESVHDLISEEELHERRRLFFTAMHRPDTRLLRAAFRELKREHCIPWEGVTELEIAVLKTGIWILRTDHHLSICYEPEVEKPNFQVQSY